MGGIGASPKLEQGDAALQSLRQKNPARPLRFARHLAKPAPTMAFVERGGLKADRVEHRRTAAPGASLVLERRQDFRSETGSAQGLRQIEQFEKQQAQGRTARGPSQVSGSWTMTASRRRSL